MQEVLGSLALCPKDCETKALSFMLPGKGEFSFLQRTLPRTATPTKGLKATSLPNHGPALVKA